MTPGEHPVKPIAAIEQQFYDLISPNEFYLEMVRNLGLDNPKDAKVLYKPDGTPFTIEELESIDKFIREQIEITGSKLEMNVIRAHIVGNILASTPKITRISWDGLPETIVEAAKQYKLTQMEVNAVRHALNQAAIGIKQIGNQASQEVINQVVRGQVEKWGTRRLKDELKSAITDTDANLNRDWKRVAITTSNDAVNDGFLMGLEPGTIVIGQSHPDACKWCLENINGKEFRVRAEAPPDYSELKPGTKEYDEIAKIHETEVWVGKTNIGRSSSPNKRIDGGYVKREHHELWMPTLTAHPNCRCFWLVKTIFD